MINLRPGIEQRIRDLVPAFSEVAGAVSLQALGQSLLAERGCYVMLDRVIAGDNQTRNTNVTQVVTVALAVVYVVRNVKDARGADAADVLAQLQSDTIAALLGWRPAGAVITPIEYQGGQLLSFSNGLLVFKDTFKTTQVLKGL